jgi:hypothetical protein
MQQHLDGFKELTRDQADEIHYLKQAMTQGPRDRGANPRMATPDQRMEPSESENQRSNEENRNN